MENNETYLALLDNQLLRIRELEEEINSLHLKLKDKEEVIKSQAGEIAGLNQNYLFQQDDIINRTATTIRVREVIKEVRTVSPRIAGQPHPNGIKYLKSKEVIEILQDLEPPYHLNKNVSNPRAIAKEIMELIARKYPEEFQVVKSPFGKKVNILLYTGDF